MSSQGGGEVNVTQCQIRFVLFTSFQVSPPNWVGSHMKGLPDCQVRIQSPEM